MVPCDRQRSLRSNNNPIFNEAIMSTEAPLSANEAFTNVVKYFANHYRNKEQNLLDAIQDGEVTTEEERDEFLLRTEPLEPGFYELPEEKQVIFDMPEKSETIEGYSERMEQLSGQAHELLQRKGELTDEIDPRIVEFVEKVASYQGANDRLASQVTAELKAEGLEGEELEDAFEEACDQADMDSGEYVEDMSALDAFICEARGIVGHPEPIAVPAAPAPGL
jgi:hypothetical protein